MTSYEDDHNIRSDPATPATSSRPRLELADFFAAISSSSSSSSASAARTDADAAAAPFRELARALQSLETHGPDVQALVIQLMQEAADPEARSRQEGVGQEYLDALDRVPRAKLRQEDTCAICNTPFIDDPYPLVVRLPCHPKHIFDMDCIAPWLKLHSTCPLDRKELKKKAPPVPPPVQEDDDGEDDDLGMYA